MKTTTFGFAALCGVVLLVGTALIPAPGPGAVRVPAALTQPVAAADVELFALSKMLDLPAVATRAQLLDAMKDSIVAKAAYVGRFRQ